MSLDPDPVPTNPENRPQDDDPAARALAEAKERRRVQDGAADFRPLEINGRAGPEPVRYGDWENRGLASDF